MKKNNFNSVNDFIDLGNLIKSLCKEKILILSISIICGLASYLYSSFQPQQFKTEIQIKNTPEQLFEHYAVSKKQKNIYEQFVYDFNTPFLFKKINEKLYELGNSPISY